MDARSGGETGEERALADMRSRRMRFGRELIRIKWMMRTWRLNQLAALSGVLAVEERCPPPAYTSLDPKLC